MRPPIIAVDDIPEEGKHLELELDSEWLRQALADTEFSPVNDTPGKASLDLHRQDRSVVLRGSIDTRLQAPCVRCLELTAFDVHADMTLLLEPATVAHRKPSRKVEEVDLSADDLDKDVYRDERIETAEWIREQILVEAPSHPSCGDTCASPLNVPQQRDAQDDPRLAPIRELLKKNKE